MLLVLVSVTKCLIYLFVNTAKYDQNSVPHAYSRIFLILYSLIDFNEWKSQTPFFVKRKDVKMALYCISEIISWVTATMLEFNDKLWKES